MIIKVCGIKFEANIRAISKLSIDMIGLNFYSPSVRYVDESVIPEWYDMLDDEVSRVGVFVDMDADDIFDYVDEYRLDYVQLHGNESLETVQSIAAQVPVIKVFRVGEDFDMNAVQEYAFVDYILFDKDSKGFGGSGHKFDWSILDAYNLEVPFLLSGGIAPDDVVAIKSFAHPKFVGIDINSKFESEPGIKDMALVESFVGALR